MNIFKRYIVTFITIDWDTMLAYTVTREKLGFFLNFTIAIRDNTNPSRFTRS